MLREKDSILSYQYRSDPALLASWKSAWHVDRDPSRAEDEEPSVPAAPAVEAGSSLVTANGAVSTSGGGGAIVVDDFVGVSPASSGVFANCASGSAQYSGLGVGGHVFTARVATCREAQLAIYPWTINPARRALTFRHNRPTRPRIPQQRSRGQRAASWIRRVARLTVRRRHARAPARTRSWHSALTVSRVPVTPARETA